MEDQERVPVSQKQSEGQWKAHDRLHHLIEKNLERESRDSKETLRAVMAAHAREHQLHEQAHVREHEMATIALNKAEDSMNRRLEGMNEFREQLNSQAAYFVTREAFERYIKENELKTDTAISALTDKWETVAKSLVNAHNTDFNSLSGEIQNEREIRKVFEGSMNTWKWLASFLGASGVAGVILLFATNT